MKKLLTWLSKSRHPYEPLILVELSQNHLINNLAEFHTLAPQNSIAPVLKSNAYGHGLIEIASILERHIRSKQNNFPIPFFIVDSYFEALALRSAGIKTPLLIIGYTRPETILGSTLKNVSFSVTSIETLQSIIEVDHSLIIQLKIDTGMKRQGILPEEILRAIELLGKTKNITLEGICSHLCDADSVDAEFTTTQINAWNEIVGKFKSIFPSIQYIHLSATDGHLFQKNINSTVTRLGIGLYGITNNEPLVSTLNLQPVMEIRTIITGVKEVRKGETIGYGNTFTAYKDIKVATIPVGYFEGLDRRLSNKGFVLVGPKRIACPIVGRVSMNITTIDVTAIEDAWINSDVVVISNKTEDPNSIVNIVKASQGTIPYEMVVKIPAHLKRVVVG